MIFLIFSNLYEFKIFLTISILKNSLIFPYNFRIFAKIFRNEKNPNG